ncbi:unnamed protein product [Arabidopsis lyrata]|uniref:Uncharacterized protein n=1 Tax=Arabidopsis lyrata subsp. lyrata TaxID=81972 RepID=D7L9P8_ARALL|nr:hypothetical protein ARALYDRAFT_896105 [Arabidopsis lyrata subsp. lyrata]CAH8258935.1 unnamed protein product [Arabidopsis lyrata]
MKYLKITSNPHSYTYTEEGNRSNGVPEWNTATGDSDGGRDDERTQKIRNQRWKMANSTTRCRSATEIRLWRVCTRQHR